MPPAKCLCGSIFWDFIHFRACFLQFCVLFTLSSLHLVWVSQLNSVRTDGRLPAGGSDSGSEVGSGTGSGRALREMHRGWRRCRGSPGPWFLVFFLSLFLPLLRNGWLLGWTGLDGLDWTGLEGWTKSLIFSFLLISAICRVQLPINTTTDSHSRIKTSR